MYSGEGQKQSKWRGQPLLIPAELSVQGGAALQPCRSSDGEEQWLCEGRHSAGPHLSVE